MPPWIWRAWLAAAILLAAGPAAAQGCGPTRLKVSESVTLDIPPAKAWAMIGDFQSMSWAKNTVSTRGSGGNRPDQAKRAVVLRGGATLEESLYRYDADAMSYSYHIDAVDVGVLPVQNTSATLEVVPSDGGAKSIIRWRAAFYRYLKPGEPAPDLADLAAERAMRSVLRQGLEGLQPEPRT